MMATDQLSVTFAALADPTRRAILARVAQGEATVLELAGVAPGTPLDGKSLMPLVGEGTAAQDDGWGETFSFLIRRPDRSYPHTAPGHLIGLRTAAFKYVWSSTGRNAYYDLLKDPHTEHNLYGDGVDIASAEQKLLAGN